ncbi:MAG: 3-oxoadipyl-CoA thiolase, partial [bacterium]
MSRAPYSMPRGPQLPKAGNATIVDTSLGWRYPNPRMEALFPLEAMGETAENVAEQLQISRADQDAFALQSHLRAAAAMDAGAFADELMPVPEGKKGELLADDEGPRRDTTLDALARLKPAFRAGGSVTAGNSSTLNDGAAAVVRASGAYARAHGLRPLARILGQAAAGVDPRTMGLGPVP